MTTIRRSVRVDARRSFLARAALLAPASIAPSAPAKRSRVSLAVFIVAIATMSTLAGQGVATADEAANQQEKAAQSTISSGETASVNAFTRNTGSGSIAVSEKHSCALNSDGAVSCWGNNEVGQLGTGVNGGGLISPSPLVALPSPGAAQAVSTGTEGTFTCSLLVNGQVSCWGSDQFGTLGDGPTTGLVSRPSEPIALPAPGKAKAIATGDRHACALLIDGKVTCWGDDTTGQLGNGAGGNQVSPPPPIALPAAAVAIGAAGYYGGGRTCAVLVDGKLFCWGRAIPTNNPSPVEVALPANTSAADVAVGRDHSCVLLRDGRIACWGFGAGVGLGSADTPVAAPTPVVLPGGSTAIAVAVADQEYASQTCALLVTKKVSCWGTNWTGQLGNGTVETFGTPPLHLTPSPPIALSADVTAIAVGAYHSCARLSNGQISCWGQDGEGQIGNGSQNGDQSVPSAPLSLARATAISAGNDQTCARLANETVSCWGRNLYGQLGVGSTSEATSPQAVALNGVDSVSAGTDVTCAVNLPTPAAVTRGLRCWGSAASGLLGTTPVTADLTSPPNDSVLSVFPVGSITVSVGGEIACAEQRGGPAYTGGFVRCWGRSAPARTPTDIAMPAGKFALQVSAGFRHACAVLTDRSVACWGDNSLGQLGTASRASSVSGVPVTLPAPGTALSVTTGDNSTCALLTDGQVTCWGRILEQTGSEVLAPAVVALPSPERASAISASGSHVCAVLTDGKVTCWGEDFGNELGNGVGMTRSLVPQPPVALPGPGTATQVASGGSHTCALLTNGGVSCWGDDYGGQLGDGAITTRQLSPAIPFSLPASPPRPEFISLVPVRLADTRAGATTIDAQAAGGGRRTAGSVFSLQVVGRGGVPADARAVALNVTVTEAGSTPGGYVSVFACDGPQPNVSTLNYGPGATVANSLVLKPSFDGKVCAYTFTDTHLIVDVTGYMPSTSTFRGVVPGRLLDTRNAATVDGLYANGGRRAAGSVLELPIGGRGGIPADAKAVALNITVTDASRSGDGYVTVFACGAQPNASTLNYGPGSTVANATMAMLNANGRICLFVSTETHLLVDVNGYFASFSDYAPTGPSRLVDTRNASTIDGQFVNGGIRPANSVLTFQVSGRGGVPATAKTAVLNLTVTGATSNGGYLTVFPCDQPKPNASSLNYDAGQTVAANAIIKLSPTGTVCVYTFQSTHLIVDVNGTFD
jgi:alpha-tubulin suppressor-like RCC1 family protein